MKGIILAGGNGTRLKPLTGIMSKQLLPVFDKPLIYYPLSTLMLAGIREIVLIVNPNQLDHFRALLGDGSNFGISICYLVQDKPNGITESLLIAKDFILGDSAALILGDNIFHGSGLGRRLANYQNIEGATIFGYSVNNPEAYGVVEFDSNGNVLSIEEKPKTPKSNVAIPGLYFFDGKAAELASKVKPSKRNELEITDLLNLYLEENKLEIEMLPRGTAWFDSGTFQDLHDASTYVRLMEERTGERVGDPYEVARTQGLI